MFGRVSRNAWRVADFVLFSNKMHWRIAARCCTWIVVVLFAPSFVLANGAQPIKLKNVPVKMRDGAVLRADVLLPAAGAKFPVLVYRTPYGKENAPKEWTTFGKAVARGYAVVIQDVRGRYSSDGEFDPYKNEGRDGYDTIEWAATQPWSNGDVGTFGLSYPGAVQWLAAVEKPQPRGRRNAHDCRIFFPFAIFPITKTSRRFTTNGSRILPPIPGGIGQNY